MKKYILIIIILLLSFFENKAQNNQPDALYFLFSNSVPKQLNINSFPQNNFMLGWQWGGNPRMTEALKMNTNQSDYLSYGIVDSNNSNISLNYIWQMKVWGCGDVPHTVSNCFIYKPTLNFDANMNVVNPTDPEHNIFGFKSKDMNLSNLDNKLYLDRELYNNNSYFNPILKNPWINDKFYSYDLNPEYVRTTIKSIDTIKKDTVWNYDWHDPSYSGQHFIITVNLRRADFSDSNNLKLNLPVLSITLPYTLVGHNTPTDNIVFDGLPDINNRYKMTYTYTVNGNTYTSDRGYCYGLTVANTNVFTIYENMLPNQDDFNNGIGPDITISASFTCKGIVNNCPNPYFKGQAQGSVMNSLDMNVNYYGNCSVLLNYIRVGNVESDSLYKGFYDKRYQELIQAGINILDKKKYKLFRFYGKDEISNYYEYWSGMRYFNRLVGGMATIEGTSTDPRYCYYTGQKEYWGMNMSYHYWVCAPYLNIRNPFEPYIDRDETGSSGVAKYGFGIRGGRLNYFQDTLNSGYETYLGHWSWHTDARETLWRLAHQYGSQTWINPTETGSTQAYTDWMLLGKFFSSCDYLYNGNFWWQNIYPIGDWNVNSDSNLSSNETARPQTGEEDRLWIWESLIRGCKGLFYDGRMMPLFLGCGNNNGGFSGNPPLESFVQNFFDTMPLDSLIYSNNCAVGSDFIPEADSALKTTNFANRDSIAKYLRIDRDRIFYGRKSPRIILQHIHSWIRLNEEKLMRLRLVANYGKGNILLQNADTANFNSNIMKSYIKVLDSAYVANPAYQNTPLDTQWRHTLPAYGFVRTARFIDSANAPGVLTTRPEPWDSSFVDITLLRDTTKSLDSVAIIGCVNRRTDPLILDSTSHSMRFLATAEFDDSCRSSNPDTAKYFKSMYWRRLGAREITLPFNYGSHNGLNWFNYLHIAELGADNDSLNDTTKYPWRGSQYYHKIDTNIALNGSLVMRLLPGEGKLVMATLKSLRENPCDICNSLDFSIDTISNCCYDLYIHNNSNCTLPNVPITLNYNNLLNISQYYNDWSLTSEIYDNNNATLIISGAIPADTTIKIASMCAEGGIKNSPYVNYTIKIGDNSTSCNKTWSGDFSCSVAEIIDCCDSINVYFSGTNFGDISEAKSCEKILNCNITNSDVFNKCGIINYNIITSHSTTSALTGSFDIYTLSGSLGNFDNENNENDTTIYNTTTINFYDVYNKLICSKTLYDTCKIKDCCDSIEVSTLRDGLCTKIILNNINYTNCIHEIDLANSTNQQIQSLLISDALSNFIGNVIGIYCDNDVIVCSVGFGLNSNSSVSKNDTVIINVPFKLLFKDEYGNILCEKDINVFYCYLNSMPFPTTNFKIASYENKEGTKPIAISNITTLSVVPNPATDELNIQVNLNTKENIKLELYNSIGNRVLDIYDGTVQKGTSAKSINTSTLSNGLYFIKLSTNNEIKTISVIIRH